MTGRNPWVVLGVPEGAPYHEVQSAFRRRVKQTHPDGGGDAREFATVVQAFDVVRRILPPEPRPCAPRPRVPRPTPYDQWLRPSPPARSWTDDGRPARGASCGPAGGWATPTIRSVGSDFSTVLRGEMSKARATAACG